jgi:hypothetical protein
LGAADLMRALPAAAMEALSEAQVKVRMARYDEAQAGIFARMLRDKEAEWARMSEADRARRAKRMYVEERILTLACPRCGQAFVDFDGCFALTCSRDKAAFCAYCLEDCGADAHRHVASCPHNTAKARSVHASSEIFEEAQRRRRVRMLKEYLAPLGAADKAAVLEDCAASFKALGIHKDL